MTYDQWKCREDDSNAPPPLTRIEKTWTLRYKETEKGAWIDTHLFASTAQGVWVKWSSPHRIPREYHSACVLRTEGM